MLTLCKEICSVILFHPFVCKAGITLVYHPRWQEPRDVAQLAHSQVQGLEPKAPTLLLGSSPAMGHTGAFGNTARPRL